MPASLLDAWGWRIAFLLGAVTVPFGLWARRISPKRCTPPKRHRQRSVRYDLPATAARLALARRHWRIMVLGLVVLGMGTIANYVAIYGVTYAQDALHLSARVGFIAESSNTLIAIPAVLFGGWLSDRHGRWPVNVGNNLALLLLIVPIFAWMVAAHSETALIVGMTTFGVVTNLSFGSFCRNAGRKPAEEHSRDGFRAPSIRSRSPPLGAVPSSSSPGSSTSPGARWRLPGTCWALPSSARSR